MKKSVISIIALAVLTLIGCKKEIVVPTQENGQNGIPCYVTVASDAVKSSFSDGAISVSGLENMSIFYQVQQDGATKYYGDNTGNTYSILATAASKNSYSFNFPQTMATGDETNEGESPTIIPGIGIIPYCYSTVRTNSGHTGFYFRLPPVQFPGNNTFDPATDILVSQPFNLTLGDEAFSGEINKFKRMFTPLIINVTGLNDDEQIYTAEFIAPALNSPDVPSPTNSLSGTFYFQVRDSYDDTKITSIEKTSGSNTLTAVYKEALDKNTSSNSWPIWFMANAIDIPSGDYTLVVTTNRRKLTKTLHAGGGISLQKDVINRVPFDMSGADEETAITQLFLKDEGSVTGGNLTASNGIDYNWVVSGSSTAYTPHTGDSFPRCLKLVGEIGATLQIPEIAGFNVIGVRIYSHGLNCADSNKATLSLLDSESNVLATYPFNLYHHSGSVDSNNKDLVYDYVFDGGVLNIDLLEGYTSLSGLSLRSDTNNNKLISAVTLILDEKPVDTNDYYAMFLAGQDIIIGGEAYNIRDYAGKYYLVDQAKQSNNNLYIREGIAFIDYSDIDENNIHTTSNNINFSDKTVLIGRYKDKQSTISSIGKQLQIGSNGLILKNIRYVSSNTTVGIVYNDPAVDGGKIILEDCTLEMAGGLIRDTDEDNFLEGIKVLNSIIKVGKNGIYYYTDAVKKISEGSMSFIEIDNCAIFNTESKSFGLTTIHAASTIVSDSDSEIKCVVAFPNLDIKITNNTTYNMAKNYPVQVTCVKSVTVDNNLGYANNGGKYYVVGVKYEGHSEPDYKSGSSMKNNYFQSINTTNVWYIASNTHLAYFDTDIKNPVNVTGNVMVQDASATPFEDNMDANIGYFPLKAEHAGRGARYDTKLWRNWEE